MALSWMLSQYAQFWKLTTANAILMKFTTLMYLHARVNRKALRVRYSFFGLNLIASLVKLLHKLANISGVFHEKPPKLGLK